MNDDDRLLDELRGLPRVEASDRFTRQVLLRLDDRQTSEAASLAWPRLGWAMAATLLLVVTITGAMTWERQRRREEIRGELALLRSAQLELLQELRQTPRALEGGLVYVGSDDRTDYLLDLGAARTVDLFRKSESVVPASNVY